MEKLDLISKIRKNAQNYYEGKPCVPDSVFDGWIEQLRLIDPSNEVLTTVGWGYDVSRNNKVKVGHLGNCYGISDKRFVDSTFKVEVKDKVLTGKFDGGNVELIYKDGTLVRAITRGDGDYGLDVTTKLAPIVPNKLPYNYSGDIVGEYLIPESNYHKFYSDAVRNIPNGMLQRDYVSEDEARLFAFVPYKIYKCKPISGLIDHNSTKLDIMKFIAKLGFKAVSCAQHSDEYSNLISILSRVYDHDNSNDDESDFYALDGIVVTDNKVSIGKADKDGYVSISYSEYALKTRTDVEEVEVTKIAWNMTRTGRYVPIAHYEPVKLSGATCHKALAHNAQNVLDSGIEVGAKIKVVRSGEVIPYILEVTEPKEVNLPTHCPYCSYKLSWRGKDLACDNANCKNKTTVAVYQWIANLGSVKNLGSSLIWALIDHYEIKDISDIYNLDMGYDSLSSIEGIGRAKINLVVEMYKKLLSGHTLSEYLVALNISGLGWNSARKIEKETSAYELFESGVIDFPRLISEIKSIKGLGDKLADNVLDNMDKITNTIEYVRLVKSSEDSLDEISESAIKIYVTGKLVNFKNRADLFKRLSGKVIKEDKIAECDYFVTNKSDLDTAHYRQAKSNGISIINEKELLDILGIEEV